jgi:thioredoxin reductase
MLFSAGPGVRCEALFFGGEQRQRSSLPKLLGCDLDEHGLIWTKNKQETGIAGLFVAGDADGEIQFAVVAAAEGAIAATAINHFLSQQEI